MIPFIPILVVVAVVAVAMSYSTSSKDSATAGGFRLVFEDGACVGIERVDLDVALAGILTFLEPRLPALALAPEKTESVLVEFWSGLFPQCTWPPADPAFPMSEGSWGLMVESLRASVTQPLLDFGGAAPEPETEPSLAMLSGGTRTLID